MVRPVYCAAPPGFVARCLQLLFQFILGLAFDVKFFQVMRRSVEKQRSCVGQMREKFRIGFGPAVADRVGIDNVYLGRFAINQQIDRRSDQTFALIRDIFPIVAKIFGGEGMSVGPPVTFAKWKVDAIVLDLKSFREYLEPDEILCRRSTSRA